MTLRSQFTFSMLMGGFLLLTTTTLAQSRVDYDLAFIGDPLPDPVMQQNKENYVIYGCAYCHGINLQPVGEAADLRISPIVAADTDANTIGPILRNGIPQTPKSSPMPQFSDLSEREIKSIAAYIHYARARERYKELMHAPAIAGDATAGRAYFESRCGSCHATQNLADAISNYDDKTLREQVLEPTRFRTPASFSLKHRENDAVSAGRSEHHVLLENYVEPDVSNVVAYLKTLK